MNNKILKLILIFIVYLTSKTACANFEVGLKYYQQSNFEKAYSEFRQAAEMGDFSAQFSLGVMYYKGEFVTKDVIQGFAWLALSAQAPEYKDQGLHLVVYNELSAEQKKSAELAFKELYFKFNTEAVENKLLPKYSTLSITDKQLHIIKMVSPEYPKYLFMNKVMGWVDITFSIGKDGTTHEHIIYNSSHELFTRTTIDAVRKWQYSPILIDGKPTVLNGVTVRLMFQLDDEVNSLKIQDTLSNLKEKALTGEPNAQYAYAYFLNILPTLFQFDFNNSTEKENQDNSNEWYLLAAKNGNALASFFFR